MNPLMEPLIGSSVVVVEGVGSVGVGVGDGAGVGVVGGATVGGDGGGDPLPSSHSATPPWWEQVPECVAE